MTPSPRRTLPLALVTALCFAQAARAADLRLVITQAQAGDARKYQPLLEYLATKGVSASFVTTPNYKSTAELFARGEADGMFGGSGISSSLILRGLAVPSVRAVDQKGVCSYAAVVIAPKGSARFDGTARYFDGKRVIFAPLASAGELFFRSLGSSSPAAALKAASHGAAIDALARGQADVAVVKNHVWESEQAKFPGLELVGADAGANPDGTFIVSKRLDPARAKAVAAALVGLKGDASAPAAAARASLKVEGYIPATEKDFAHTTGMLQRAGVTKDFEL